MEKPCNKIKRRRRIVGMLNGPLKRRSLGKFYPSLRISHNLLMGLGVSDFVSVGHIN